MLSTIFQTRFAAQYLVYFFDMSALIMSFIGAAYVVVCTVMATVDFETGLYHKYASWSNYANLIAVFELVIMMLFMGWALVTVILALVWAPSVGQA